MFHAAVLTDSEAFNPPTQVSIGKVLLGLAAVAVVVTLIAVPTVIFLRGKFCFIIEKVHATNP